MAQLHQLRTALETAGFSPRGHIDGSVSHWTIVEPPYEPQSAGTLALLAESFADDEWERCARNCMSASSRGAVAMVRGPGPDSALSLRSNTSLATLVGQLTRFFGAQSDELFSLVAAGTSIEGLVEHLAGNGLTNLAWIDGATRTPLIVTRSVDFATQVRSLPLHELLGIYPHRAVIADGETAGWILAYPPEGPSPDADEMLGRGSAALSLTVERSNRAHAHRTEQREDLWRDLLFAHPAELNILAERASRELPHGELAVGLLTHGPRNPEDVNVALRTLCRQSVLTPFLGGWAFSVVRDDLPKLERQSSPFRDYRVAIGGFRLDRRSLRASLDEALTALEAFPDRPSPLVWERLDDAALLLPLARGDEGRRFVRRRLAPLADKTELIETLAALTRQNWRGAKAARDLGIHYNTLRQRLDRLGELTPELLDEGHRFALALALRLRELDHILNDEGGASKQP